MKKAVGEEEVYWRNKSRTEWLKLGDRNMAFFHAWTVQRRVQSRIHGLEDDQGVLREGRGDVQNIILQYFSTIFTSSNPFQFDAVLRCLNRRVTAQMNCQLTRQVTAEEVKMAVFQMDTWKAPGPDGFTAPFSNLIGMCWVRILWQPFGASFTQGVFLGASTTHTLFLGASTTHIVLIPKVKCPVNMGQLRPISLCNVTYKVIAKVLANRLSLYLPNIVSENQGAFVAGRLIHDNVILGQEVIHHLKSKRKGGRHEMAVKLDMCKAYDRVEWRFIEVVMHHRLGFSDLWIRWIMECISSVSYSVLINGEKHGFISPSRGLQQGDPLSPFLFVLCAEGFSAMLSNAEYRGVMHGVRVCRGAPSINHLFFADDTLIFSRANDVETDTIRTILEEYSRASGQVINFAKSAVFFSANTPNGVRERMPVLGDPERRGNEKLSWATCKYWTDEKIGLLICEGCVGVTD